MQYATTWTQIHTDIVKEQKHLLVIVVCALTFPSVCMTIETLEDLNSVHGKKRLKFPQTNNHSKHFVFIQGSGDFQEKFIQSFVRALARMNSSDSFSAWNYAFFLLYNGIHFFWRIQIGIMALKLHSAKRFDAYSNDRFWF